MKIELWTMGSPAYAYCGVDHFDFSGSAPIPHICRIPAHAVIGHEEG